HRQRCLLVEAVTGKSGARGRVRAEPQSTLGQYTILPTRTVGACDGPYIRRMAAGRVALVSACDQKSARRKLRGRWRHSQKFHTAVRRGVTQVDKRSAQSAGAAIAA